VLRSWIIRCKDALQCLCSKLVLGVLRWAGPGSIECQPDVPQKLQPRLRLAGGPSQRSIRKALCPLQLIRCNACTRRALLRLIAGVNALHWVLLSIIISEMKCAGEAGMLHCQPMPARCMATRGQHLGRQSADGSLQMREVRLQCPRRQAQSAATAQWTLQRP
jgi:hypothetical protein